MAALVTDLALADVVNALIAADVTWVGWGSGTGQGVGDDNLASALPEDRTHGTGAAVTTNTADDTYRVSGSIVATADETVSEVGVFSGISGDNLAVYGEFSPIALSAGDTINFSVDVIVDQGA